MTTQPHFPTDASRPGSHPHRDGIDSRTTDIDIDEDGIAHVPQTDLRLYGSSANTRAIPQVLVSPANVRPAPMNPASHTSG